MLETSRTATENAWVDRTMARFDALNDGLVIKTRSLLHRIVGDTSLHPRFLNTLSMLEHMGSHKIMATQHGPTVAQPTLKHLAEECHHAFFMKRQAEKAAGRPLEYVEAELLAPRAARMYFQRLEATMLRALRPDAGNTACYLYMSMIVEFRAVWFYGLFQQALKRQGHPLSLKRLLGEEQNHLTDMADRLEHARELSDTRVESFIGTEHALYERLLGSLQHSAT